MLFDCSTATEAESYKTSTNKAISDGERSGCSKFLWPDLPSR
jgi:hypothetical protein